MGKGFIQEVRLDALPASVPRSRGVRRSDEARLKRAAYVALASRRTHSASLCAVTPLVQLLNGLAEALNLFFRVVVVERGAYHTGQAACVHIE